MDSDTFGYARCAQLDGALVLLNASGLFPYISLKERCNSSFGSQFEFNFLSCALIVLNYFLKMFDTLPLHIRETIFSRVRYIDLFETVRVSQGWWTLTMASFERFLHKKDDFLLDQVDFCNQMMPKDEPWEWWMLMEFTKSKRLFLEISDFHALIAIDEGRLIQYFRLKGIHVKHLIVDKGESNNEVLKLLPNLDEAFPCLMSLEVDGVAQDSTIIFTLHLTSFRYGLGRMSSGSMGLRTSELKVLDLKGCEFLSLYLLDALKFVHKLTRLSVSAHGLFNMGASSTGIERILKSVLRENKMIKSVSFHHAEITKEWLKIFPANVVKIELFEPRLDQDLVKAFGNNVFYERLLLMYICEEWKSVVNFKTYSMSWETFQEELGDAKEVDDEEEEGNKSPLYIENAYQVDYVCKPTMNEETIVVKYSKVAINELVSRKNQGLFLTELMYYHHSYTFPIPPNVRNLGIIQNRNYPFYDDFELVLEDPTALQVLGCHKGRMVTFPKMINLREVSFTDCNESLLVSILRSCNSLSKLILWSPESAVFGNVPLVIKSLSLKGLTIIDGSDTFQDILTHFPSLNSLTLENHCMESILKSEVSAIKSLQYFKVIMRGNKEVAVHLSSLHLPYMLFVNCNRWHYFAASKGFKLINEISRNTSRNNTVKASKSFLLSTKFCSVSHEEGSFVFTKNIPTRFLRNTCHLVNTVQDFVDKSFNVQNRSNVSR